MVVFECVLDNSSTLHFGILFIYIHVCVCNRHVSLFVHLRRWAAELQYVENNTPLQRVHTKLKLARWHSCVRKYNNNLLMNFDRRKLHTLHSTLIQHIHSFNIITLIRRYPTHVLQRRVLPELQRRQRARSCPSRSRALRSIAVNTKRIYRFFYFSCRVGLSALSVPRARLRLNH